MPRLLLPTLFLLCAVPVLVFLALWVPTGESPDEVAHIIRAESLRWGQVVGHRETHADAQGRAVIEGGVRAHTALLAAGFAATPGEPLERRRMTRARLEALDAIPWDPAPAFVSIPNTAVYPPLTYLASGLGMQVGKRLGYGPWRAIMVARLFNAAAYAAIGLVALLVARRGQGVLFAVLVLPASLWMAASCNQDGPVIALAVLAAALLTRGTLAAWWGAAAALAVVIMAKPPYLPLAGAVFALLPRRGALPTLRLAGLFAAAAPGVAWYLFARARAAVPFVSAQPFQPGPHWTGDPGQTFTAVDPALQLQVLLHKPALLITLPLDTIAALGGWTAWEIVGLLGVLDLPLPGGLYGLWAVAAIALLLGESLVPGRAAAPGGLASLTVAACTLLAAVAVYEGQYLTWTRTGAALIDGVQGRYFVPLLPFLGLALPGVRVPGAGLVRGMLRAPAVGAAMIGAAVIPGLVVGAYYLR